MEQGEAPQHRQHACKRTSEFSPARGSCTLPQNCTGSSLQSAEEGVVRKCLFRMLGNHVAGAPQLPHGTTCSKGHQWLPQATSRTCKHAAVRCQNAAPPPFRCGSQFRPLDSCTSLIDSLPTWPNLHSSRTHPGLRPSRSQAIPGTSFNQPPAPLSTQPWQPRTKCMAGGHAYHTS